MKPVELFYSTLYPTEPLHTLEDRDVCVIQTTRYADIDAHEIHPTEVVVSEENHANVCDGDIFQCTNDGCGERAVQCGAQEDGVVQDAAHERCQHEHKDKCVVAPLLIVIYLRKSA